MKLMPFFKIGATLPHARHAAKFIAREMELARAGKPNKTGMWRSGEEIPETVEEGLKQFEARFGRLTQKREAWEMSQHLLDILDSEKLPQTKKELIVTISHSEKKSAALRQFLDEALGHQIHELTFQRYLRFLIVITYLHETYSDRILFRDCDGRRKSPSLEILRSLCGFPNTRAVQRCMDIHELAFAAKSLRIRVSRENDKNPGFASLPSLRFLSLVGLYALMGMARSYGNLLTQDRKKHVPKKSRKSEAKVCSEGTFTSRVINTAKAIYRFLQVPSVTGTKLLTQAREIGAELTSIDTNMLKAS